MRNSFVITVTALAGVLAFSVGCDGCGGGDDRPRPPPSSSSGNPPPPWQPPPCFGTMCNGTCTNLNESSEHCGACNRPCGAAQYCDHGTCKSDPCGGDGMAECFGVCKDLLSDSKNCGMCNYACPAGQTCQYAECHPAPTVESEDEDGTVN